MGICLMYILLWYADYGARCLEYFMAHECGVPYGTCVWNALWYMWMEYFMVYRI